MKKEWIMGLVLLLAGFFWPMTGSDILSMLLLSAGMVLLLRAMRKRAAKKA